MPATAEPIVGLDVDPEDGASIELRGMSMPMPLFVLRACWRMEDADFTLWIDETGVLRVGPASRLSLEDQAFIKRHYCAVRRLVAYVPPPEEAR